MDCLLTAESVVSSVSHSSRQTLDQRFPRLKMIILFLCFFLSAMSFEFVVKSDLGGRSLHEKFERYHSPNDCATGEYLNLCAECVSGQTEKEDDFGADSCGVCDGFESCKLQCSDPMADIDDEISQDTGCTKLISVTPNLLDLSESSEGSISILGDGISPETLQSITCSLKKDETDTMKFDGKVLEDKIELNFLLPESVGEYMLSCNTSTGIDFRERLTVVDTASLQPMAVDNGAIVTWMEKEVKLNVAKMSGPAAVVCFGRESSGSLVYLAWTPRVEGNGLSSTVVCPKLVLVRPGELELGIAYSTKAIKSAKTIKLNGVALSPKPTSAIYIPELSRVKITFDQNLEEGKLLNCKGIFKESSLNIFGRGAVCEAVANEIRVDVKDKSALMRTVLEFTDNVRTKFSEVAVEGSVPIDFPSLQDVKGRLRVEGEEKICPGEFSEVKLEGQEEADVEVKVVPKNLTGIPIGQRQRLNMLAWRANRSSRAKSFKINSTDLIAGIKYQVQAKQPGGNEAKLDLSLASPSEVWVRLKGPKDLDLSSSAFFQATVKSCGQQVSPDNYLWEVTSYEGEKIYTSLQNGPKLELDGGLLKPNEEYNVLVKVMEGDKLLGSAYTTLKTTFNLMDLKLQESSIKIGTGHTLEIDGSKAVSAYKKLIKFKWKCKDGYCYEPNRNKTSLNNLGVFSQPVLRLPPKSLAIGIYNFELEGSSKSVTLNSTVEINVVGGEPPFFSSLSVTQLADLTIKLEVSQIRGSCNFYWESVPTLGLAYLTINRSRVLLEGSPHSPVSGTLDVIIPGSQLQAGAQYRLRCVADCGRMAQSHFQFNVFVPERFPEFHLNVEPTKGVALETNFTFKITSGDSSTNFIFSFGFEDSGFPKFFRSSHDETFTTIIGHGVYKTIAKICRTKSDCIATSGPEISTSSPNNLGEKELSQFFKIYSELMLSNDYPHAKCFLEMILSGIKDYDLDKWENYSLQVQKFILSRILVYIYRLKADDSCLEDAVHFLDAVTDVLTILPKSDEEVVSSVLDLRDLIHHTMQNMTVKNNKIKISANLPAEPRSKAGEILRSKRKTVKTKKEDTEKMVNALLKLDTNMLNITNDTVKIIQVKLKILNSLVTYAIQFCNELEDRPYKEAGAGNDFWMIGSRKYNSLSEVMKIKFPQCYKISCPNVTGLATVRGINISRDSMKPEGFCLTTAYLRDDILSDVSSRAIEPGIMRWAPVYWIDLLPYANSVVDDKIFYPYFLPKIDESHISEVIKKVLSNKGNLILQLPLWKEPQPNGTIFMCSRFENGAWNMSSCRKREKEIPGFILCVCPYPGYISVFAIPHNLSEDGTSFPGVIVNSTAIVNTPAPSMTEKPPTTGKPPMTGKPPTTEKPPTTVLSATIGTTLGITVITSPSNTTNESKTGVNITLLPDLATKPVVTTAPPVVATSTVGVPTLSITTPRQVKQPESPNSSSGPTISAPEKQKIPDTAKSNPFKYSAYFRINETFNEKVGKNGKKFLDMLENQLKAKFNLTLPASVEPEEGKIKVMLHMDEKNLSSETHRLSLLGDLLRNGSLVLRDLEGKDMTVPSQDLHFMEKGSNVSSATTAFISVIFMLLIVLIGSLITAIYLRTTREQRSLRLTQDLYEEPPAPKYLRLHDSVSLGSSGPSSPSLANEMESSLAVVTRTQTKGYESVDQFSNLPGNI